MCGAVRGAEGRKVSRYRRPCRRKGLDRVRTWHSAEPVFRLRLSPCNKKLTISASKYLCATRHTTTLATMLFFHQTAIKTLGLFVLKLGNVNRVQHVALYGFFSRHGSSNLLPFYWWISLPIIYCLTFFSMLGLLIRYPVDGMDIDARKVNTYWVMVLQHEHGIEISTSRRRGSFGYELYYSGDDYSEAKPDPYGHKDTREDTADEGKVHLPMSTVLKLRRDGVDLEAWRYGVRQPTMADSRPSWL